MAINSNGYLIRAGQGPGSWRSRSTNSVNGVGRNQTHSEIATINALRRIHANGPFLIEQDGFPCAACDTTFVASGLSIAFKITANNGRYSADHGLGQNHTSFPYYIWYHARAKTHGTGTVPPQGFPTIPSVTTV